MEIYLSLSVIWWLSIRLWTASWCAVKFPVLQQTSCSVLDTCMHIINQTDLINNISSLPVNTGARLARSYNTTSTRAD